MRTARRKTCKRYDGLGDAHFITFSCFKRRPFLCRDRACEILVDSIDLARKTYPFDLWAWVIMPEHIHLLLLPLGETRISQLLNRIKLRSAKIAINWVRENQPGKLRLFEDTNPDGRVQYRFWLPGGGYDRNIRSTDEVNEKLRYIHNNPVNRGLAQRAIDFRWSSARTWELGGAEPLGIDRESFARSIGAL